MGNGFLSQEEIDALLKQAEESLEIEISNQDRIVLTAQEQDILGEIGNINAGAASTALSELLGQRVIMDVPKIWVTTYQELHESYQVPYILVEVNYISGIEGSNQFVIKTSDAAIIADLMMGGNGKNPPSELDEISISAVSITHKYKYFQLRIGHLNTTGKSQGPAMGGMQGIEIHIPGYPPRTTDP
jgi:flagellar motor switch protein FliN/FliY